MRVSKNEHEEAVVVVMKIFSRALNSLLVACVLAAGASAYGVPFAQRGDKKGPPPKEEKVVPKEDKRPKSEERRDDNRREQPPRNDNRKKGDG
jgi:hypothetical protein